MGFFDKIKEIFVGKPVTGIAIITDVEEVENYLEQIVDESMKKKNQDNTQ